MLTTAELREDKVFSSFSVDHETSEDPTRRGLVTGVKDGEPNTSWTARAREGGREGTKERGRREKRQRDAGERERWRRVWLNEALERRWPCAEEGQTKSRTRTRERQKETRGP